VRRHGGFELLLPVAVALLLWLLGTLIGLGSAHAYPALPAANSVSREKVLFARILVRNVLVSTMLISGTFTLGITTIATVAINSISFGRFVFPRIFSLHDNAALLTLTLAFELRASLKT
jgi:uncharacterized membrane protein SpoIIM required for sporulation